MTSPAKFADTKGRSYEPALDYLKLRAILSRTQLDFGDVETFADTWAQVLVSEHKAIACLWISIADRAGISEDEWLAAMDGECLEAGTDALLEAVKSFTRPQKRGMIIAGAEMIHKRYKEAIKQATKAIETITDKTIAEAVARLGTQPQNVPESSDILTSAGV